MKYQELDLCKNTLFSTKTFKPPKIKSNLLTDPIGTSHLQSGNTLYSKSDIPYIRWLDLKCSENDGVEEG